jgi:hypothetical protein
MHPELAAHLSWLPGDRMRSMSKAQWTGWWDDFETLLERLRLPAEKTRERRANYEPVDTGGFERLLRTTVKTVLTGRSHAFANIERFNNLLDLVVCRNRGVFHRRSDVVAAPRNAANEHGGWSAALREVADVQPPAPAMYSSLRDKDLLAELARARGVK